MISKLAKNDLCRNNSTGTILCHKFVSKLLTSVSFSWLYDRSDCLLFYYLSGLHIASYQNTCTAIYLNNNNNNNSSSSSNNNNNNNIQPFLPMNVRGFKKERAIVQPTSVSDLFIVMDAILPFPQISFVAFYHFIEIIFNTYIKFCF